MPNKVIYAGGAWLVALSTAATGSDAVVVINPSTLQITKTITVDMDITVIAGDNNYLYAYSTNGNIHVFSLSNGDKVSSISGVYSISDLEVNPVNGNLYGVGSNYLVSYQITDGKIALLKQVSGSSYYGSKITVIPDGKHILLNSGVVLASSTNADADMVYVTKIPTGSPAAVDTLNNELYVVSERLIQVYDTSDFTFKRIIPETQATSYLFCSAGKLIIGQKDDSNALTFTDADA